MAGTVSMRDWRVRALAPGSNAAASRTGRRSSKAKCTSAGSAGRATRWGAGCCAAISATTNIGRRPWGALMMPPPLMALTCSALPRPRPRRARWSRALSWRRQRQDRAAHGAAGDWPLYRRTSGATASRSMTSQPQRRAHSCRRLAISWSAELTAEQLRSWLATMAAPPAQRRAKGGKPQYRPAPTTDEEIRQRRASANRVLTMLKAALNHAYDEGHVGKPRRLGPQARTVPRKSRVARVRYLTVAEAERLINACEPDFRALVPRRAGNRLPLLRAHADGSARLQPRCQHVAIRQIEER